MTPGIPEVPLRRKGKTRGEQGETRPVPGREGSSGRPTRWRVREDLRPWPWHHCRERLHCARACRSLGTSPASPGQDSWTPGKQSHPPNQRPVVHCMRTREHDTVVACFLGSKKQVPTLSHTGCHLDSSKFSRVWNKGSRMKTLKSVPSPTPSASMSSMRREVTRVLNAPLHSLGPGCEGRVWS